MSHLLTIPSLILAGLVLSDVSYSITVSTALIERAKEGQKALLRCSFSGELLSDVHVVVLWQRYDESSRQFRTVYNTQNQYDKQHSDERLKLAGAASLEISATNRSDAGKYRCQVTPLPSFDQGEGTTQLQVWYPPEFPGALYNHSYHLSNGEEIVLLCHAKGMPNVVNYTWFHRKVSDVKERKLIVDDVKNKNLELILRKNLQVLSFSEADEGTYFCKARNSVGSRSLEYRLFLKRPATITRFSISPDVVVEGGDVQMVVEAWGVPNNLSFKWSYHGESIDLFGWSSIFGFRGKGNLPYLRISRSNNQSRLEIKDVTRAIAGNYSCTAYNEVGDPTRADFKLDVQYLPYLSVRPAARYAVAEGGLLSMRCAGTGNPPPWFEWDTPLLGVLSQAQQHSRYRVHSNGNLTVSSTFRNDSGSFSCSVHNDVGRGEAAMTTVSVWYTPIITEHLNPQYDLEFGSNFTLRCLSIAFPEARLTWYKNVTKILPGDDHRLVVNASTLSLVDVGTGHSGMYRCQVENSLGMVFSDTLVHVRHAPSIIEITSSRRVMIGNSVNITCISSGYPSPTIEWSYSPDSTDNATIVNGVTNGTRGRTYILSQRLASSSLRSTLTINRVGLRDCGLYHCMTKNPMGEDKKIVDVRCSDVPYTLDSITLSDVTQSGFTIHWSLPSYTTGRHQFDCEVTDHDRVIRVNVPCNVTSYVVTSLNASTVYDFTLYVTNTNGIREPLHKQNVTTEGGREKLNGTGPTVFVEGTATPNTNTPLQQSTLASNAFHNSPVTAFSVAGINRVIYDPSQGWVKWHLNKTTANALNSSYSARIPQHLKVEAKKRSSADWRLVTWCLAVRAEVCYVNLSADGQWQVRVRLCWSRREDCGEPVLARRHTAATEADEVAAGTAIDLPVAAIVASAIALLSAVVVYALSLAFIHRRRKMALKSTEATQSKRATKFSMGYDNRAMMLDEDVQTSRVMSTTTSTIDIETTSQNSLKRIPLDVSSQEMSLLSGVRDCHVIKKPEEEFEFFLKVDENRRGQVITSLTKGGPADRAGAQDGDRLIEVNGVNVESKSHDAIVEIIRECIPKNEISFKLISEVNDVAKSDSVKEKEPSTKKNGVLHDSGESNLKPRICKITKKGNTFGFNLLASKGKSSGHFIKEVVEDGPAVESGLKNGDRIIEVGGKNVEKMNHEKVIVLIKKGGNKVELLVADESTYKHFLKMKKKIKRKHAYSSTDQVISNSRPTSSSSGNKSVKTASSTTALPNKEEVARIVHILKHESKGYGFFLRVKKDEPGEYLGDISQGSASEVCGLANDDLVVAINGQVVVGMGHSDVVSLVKSMPNNVVFVVLGPNAVKNVKENGLLSVLEGAKEPFLTKPKICQLERSANGFGFFLKMDKGCSLQMISDVETDSVAQQAGLNDGDILLAVSGNDVTKDTHDACVKKIKEAGNTVSLTVATKKTAESLGKLGISCTNELVDNWPSNTNLSMPDFREHADNFMKKAAAIKVVKKAIEEKVEEEDKKLLPRLCTVVREDGALGFFLRNDGGHFLSRVESSGPAAKVGVKENDEIIEVNGVNVEKDTHDQVVEKIKNSGDRVTFLLVNSEEKSYFTAKAIVISSALLGAAKEAASESEQNRPLPRLCVLKKGDAGFGFHLNTEGGDRPGQYVHSLQKDGPAEIAGLKEGDRVVEINENNIAGEKHDAVVQIIVKSGSQVEFLVVDEDTDLYYKRKGIKITAALAVPDSLAEEKKDTHSSTSSTVEAEATVHVDAQEPDEPEPNLTFPPPPDHEDSVNDERELKEEVDDELREDIVEELKDEVKEELAEEVEEKLQDELEEEIVEAIVEAVKNEIEDENKEEILDEVKEAIEEDVLEAIEDAVQEKAVEEAKDEIKEAIAEAAAVAIMEELIENRDDIPEAVIDQIQEAVEEHIEDKLSSREPSPTPETALAATVAAVVIEETASVPPSPPPVAPITNIAHPASTWKKQPSVTRTPPASPASNGVQAPTSVDISKAVTALKPVSRPNVSSQKANEQHEDKPPTGNGFSNLRAMFEQKPSAQQAPAKRPAWIRTSSSGAKNIPAPASESKPKPPTANGQATTAKQPSWGGGKPFMIVETSSVFQ